ncbi:hypothetical protein [Spiroplasma endosymbiont of Labia minor]|uniref:hypothetical protein n=1 Tax=Spiroplasma endosymbiont of Labia minor TaxID=3066305 RepID=UPI0030D38970
MRTEKYASLEITKTEIRFEVVKYRYLNIVNGQSKKTIKVIYKYREKGLFLTDDGVVADPKLIGRHLRNAIDKYEREHSTKIENVALVLPTNKIKILESSLSRILTLPGSNSPVKITQNLINEINNDFSKSNFNKNESVVLIRPTRFVIDDNIIKGVKPLNKFAHKLTINANVYFLPTELVNSHYSVLKLAKVNLLNMIISPFALANVAIQHSDFKNSVNVLVNWDYDCVSLSFFARETLTYYRQLKIGLNKMITNIAKKMNAKPQVIEGYLFNLTDFKYDDMDNSLIYRKYDKISKQTKEYSVEQIKAIILEEINEIIDKMDFYIENDLKTKTNSEITIYHVGKITNISGFTSLLRRSNISKQKVYFSQIIGANEIWTIALTGAAIINHKINKGLANPKYSEWDSNILESNVNQQNAMNNNNGMQQQRMPEHKINQMQPNYQQQQMMIQNQNSQPEFMPSNGSIRPGAHHNNLKGLDPNKPIYQQLHNQQNKKF